MTDNSPDLEVENLKAARNAAATLKMRLAQIRADSPDTVILVFEGGDDKIAYRKWVDKIRPDLEYESMCCGPKPQVIKLMRSAVSDRQGLIDKVYFFIDRDYDDLQNDDGHPHLFMTDQYSIENYVVCEQVVSAILSDCFHCNGHPEVRKSLLDVFTSSYREFLEVTRDLNFRIYAARQTGKNIDGLIPDKLNKIAQVSFDTVEPPAAAAATEIQLDHVADNDLAELRRMFEDLDPRSRYRGKFAFMFLKRWLDDVSRIYSAEDSEIFSNIDRTNRVRANELVLSNFASMSPFPAQLEDFLAAA